MSSCGFVRAKFFIAALVSLILPVLHLGAVSMLPRETPTLNSSRTLLEGWDFTAEAGTSERQAYAEGLTVKLQTIGNGDAVWEWFGHSAIVIEEPDKRPVMFDYGIFDLASDNFFFDFARGRMLYRVISSDALWRQDWSTDVQRRDVRTMEIELSPDMKLALVEFLVYNTSPGNDTYLYHHYYDNCATRIRDIIDAMTGGQFGEWARSIPGTGTYRDHVRRHSYASPLWAWLLDYLQSSVIDKPLTLWEEMFLPEILEQAILDFPLKNEGVNGGNATALATVVNVISDTTGQGIRPEVADTAPIFVTRTLIFGVALAVFFGFLHYLLIRTKRKSDGHSPILPRILYGVPLGLLFLALSFVSLLLLFMMFFSTHDVAWWNENIIFINPLLIIPAVYAFRIAFGRKEHECLVKLSASMRCFALATCALMIFKCLFSDTFFQMNWNIIASIFPLYAVLGWLVRPSLPLKTKKSTGKLTET
ncbi:lipoprotein N-acyltransferase Lnb domain-containing protein [Parasphaerochaeta coccoides]|nr:DUF4105 domain-containing protein [Parasphaerochaeta coccoides]